MQVTDPDRDLLFERLIPAPRPLVWRCWTEPALLMEWFCPRPWRVTDCEIDLRPGGIFRTRMEGPGGESHDGPGVWLEVVAKRRLVFTDALLPGWRPSGRPFMTGVVSFADEGEGTRYRAEVLHATPEARAQHEAMGFEAGWGAAADQLATLAAALAAARFRVEPEGESVIRVMRRFEAPRARVFEAMLDPALVLRWLWATDHPMVLCESDPRPGGRLRYVWEGPRGRVGLSGTYAEVEAPARFSHDEVWDEPWFEGTCRVVTELAEDGTGCVMEARIAYDSAAARDSVLATPMAEGMGEAYARLDRLLEP